MSNETIDRLVSIVHTLFEQNNALREELKQLDVNYQELADDYIKLQMENIELNRSCEYSESCVCDDGCNELDSINNSIEPIPPEQMSTISPIEAKKSNGIFPSPASVSNSMVTGTTNDKCYALTAVLQDLNQGVTVSKRILIEQGLFEYKHDTRGHNRYQPTDWFKSYAMAHGILAEFTGHASTQSGDKTFSWYKVTSYGTDIIKKTASGDIVWKKFESGPSEWGGYIPVPSSTSNN